MECKLFIHTGHREEVHIYAHERTPLVDAIERLVQEDQTDLIGYDGKEGRRLSPAEIDCFVVENNKIYALCGSEKRQLKCRLYQLEGQLPDTFVKINQSCVANIRRIERFDASIAGTLRVLFRGGYTDYVSRRNVKHVKERLGVL